MDLATHIVLFFPLFFSSDICEVKEEKTSLGATIEKGVSKGAG